MLRLCFPKRADISHEEVDFELVDLIESFNEIALCDSDADSFDDVLDCLYDWADTNRVWVC